MPRRPVRTGSPIANSPVTEREGRASLLFAGRADPVDMATFLDRATWFDQSTLVRLRASQGRVTAFVRLPFGVLVSRTARLVTGPDDITVRADELAAVLTSGGDGDIEMPEAHDLQWRGGLPPSSGWARVDEVPTEVIHRLVRAGASALRAAGGGGAAGGLGATLLDHESLTVSGGGHTVALPLRVLSAVSRMGFLGPVRADPAADLVVISVCGGWARIAAAFGSAYLSGGGPPAFLLR